MHTVKEKMQKVYSFTGTQLFITGLGVVILLWVLGFAIWDGDDDWHDRGRWHEDRYESRYEGRYEKWMEWDRQQENKKQDDNKKQLEPIMNNDEQNTQSTPPSVSTGTRK